MNYHLPILAYHKVEKRRELGITSIPPQKFESQIKFLKSNGFKSISPNFLFDQTRSTNHTQGRPILITFDDGYRGIYDHAYPIMLEYGFTGIVFLTVGYVGKNNSWDSAPGPRFKHLSWDQVREMAKSGFLIGSHGMNHKFLTRLANEEARYEILLSKTKLEDSIGERVDFFSYPYGNYDERILDLVAEAGYRAGFSLEPKIMSSANGKNRPQIGFNKYAIPRIAIYLIDSITDLKAKLNYYGNAYFYIESAKNKVINRFSYASMFIKR